ncbi:unnamed protein product [Peronospora farinosa]|uniref:Endonuclease/exonuclease/phosphatase domain-containing protein n=1 Tax=Peronospora farinosa TaxID=134698 RepID=A0AAV0UMH6_9STRA|nr:unnamed protein product [Peronospora farinosa]
MYQGLMEYRNQTTDHPTQVWLDDWKARTTGKHERLAYQRGEGRLFRLMRELPWPQVEVVLFGNFNCVQSPHLDRLGGLRSGRPESPELESLLQALGLEDAQTLAASAMEDEVPEPVDYYTFWNARSSRRIDRFYVGSLWKRSSRRFKYNCLCFILTIK